MGRVSFSRGRVTLSLSVSLLLLAFCAVSAAQSESFTDVLKVDYFDNANLAGHLDAKLRLTNEGTSGVQNVCAAIYVFGEDEQMQACCNCFLSIDGLRKLSVDNDLTSNPIINRPLHIGTLRIVSNNAAAENSCPDPGSGVVPIPGVRAWASHLQEDNHLTETASQDATLNPSELSSLQLQCSFLELSGSGRGFCTCGTGD